MNSNSHDSFTPRVLAFALALALAGCAAAAFSAIGDAMLGVARKTFLGVATKNYGDQYTDDFDKVLTALAKPSGDAGTSAGTPGSNGASGTNGSTSTDPAAGTTNASAPLELQVALMKEEIHDGRSIPVPVVDGETVYDRFGAHGAGDNLKISFRTNADAYVYVISIDGTGWAQPVFPSKYAGGGNPVRANQEHMIPEGSNWVPLDSYRGVEHLFFLASREQRPDLEQALTQLQSHVREEDPKRVQEQIDTMAEVAQAAPVTRGLGEARPSMVHDVESSSGEKFNVDAQIFASRGAGDVVMTRWFRHQ